MAKFKVGDPVWANDFRNVFKVINGERAAVVTGIVPRRTGHCRVCNRISGYLLDILPHSGIACECCLRPRRDDYQQHEELGSMDQVRRAITFDSVVWSKAKCPVDLT